MHQKALKIVCWIIAGLILFAVALYFLVRTPLWWDDTTVNDSDLQIPASEPVPSANNAATYIPIQGEVTPTEEIILDNIPKYTNGEFFVNDIKMPNTELRKYVSDSAPLVAKFEKAAAQPAYQCPLSFNQIDFAAELCRLGTLRNLGSLTAFHAHYNDAVGQPNRAAELISATLKMGKLVTERQSPGGPLIETLVGIALTKTGIEALEKSDTLQNKLVPVMANYKLKDDVFTLTLKYEYQSFKNTMYDMNNWQSLAGRGTYLIQPNQTLNIYAEIMRVNIEGTLTPCDQVQVSAKIEKELKTLREGASSFPGIIKQNLLGRVFISTVAASLGSLQGKRCEINNQIDKLSKKKL